jgi:hypothetical protein
MKFVERHQTPPTAPPGLPIPDSTPSKAYKKKYQQENA